MADYSFVDKLILPAGGRKYSGTNSKGLLWLCNTNGENFPNHFIKKRSKVVILYSHGNGGTLGDFKSVVSFYSEWLSVSVFAIEYPGYGPAEGISGETSVNDNLRTAFRYLLELGYPAKNIVLMGYSIGTGPTIQLASELCENNTPPGAIITIAAYLSVCDIVRDLKGAIIVSLFAETITNRWQSVEKIKTVNCPSLFIHGQMDAMIPHEHSIRLHENCAANQKTVHICPTADHTHFEEPGDTIEPIITFLDEVLQPLSVYDITVSPTMYICPQSIINKELAIKLASEYSSTEIADNGSAFCIESVFVDAFKCMFGASMALIQSSSAGLSDSAAMLSSASGGEDSDDCNSRSTSPSNIGSAASSTSTSISPTPTLGANGSQYVSSSTVHRPGTPLLSPGSAVLANAHSRPRRTVVMPSPDRNDQLAKTNRLKSFSDESSMISGAAGTSVSGAGAQAQGGHTTPVPATTSSYNTPGPNGPNALGDIGSPQYSNSPITPAAAISAVPGQAGPAAGEVTPMRAGARSHMKQQSTRRNMHTPSAKHLFSPGGRTNRLAADSDLSTPEPTDKSTLSPSAVLTDAKESVAVLRKYFAALNEHNVPKILTFLSDDISIRFRFKQCNPILDKLGAHKHFMNVFAKLPAFRGDFSLTDVSQDQRQRITTIKAVCKYSHQAASYSSPKNNNNVPFTSSSSHSSHSSHSSDIGANIIFRQVIYVIKNREIILIEYR